MAKNYLERIAEERRLVILRLLYELPEQRANSSSLYHALDGMAMHASRADVRAELHWLAAADRELVVVEDITPPAADSPLLLARLTERGADCAKGKVTVHGVQRPGK